MRLRIGNNPTDSEPSLVPDDRRSTLVPHTTQTISYAGPTKNKTARLVDRSSQGENRAQNKIRLRNIFFYRTHMRSRICIFSSICRTVLAMILFNQKACTRIMQKSCDFHCFRKREKLSFHRYIMSLGLKTSFRIPKSKSSKITRLLSIQLAFGCFCKYGYCSSFELQSSSRLRARFSLNRGGSRNFRKGGPEAEF